MGDKSDDPESISPALAADWFKSRWGRDDQRGNGNLVTAQKVLEAVRLIKTGEIVSLGMPVRFANAARARTRIRLANARRSDRRPLRREEQDDLE